MAVNERQCGFKELMAMTVTAPLMATAQTKPMAFHRDRHGAEGGDSLQQQKLQLLNQAEAAAGQGDVAASAKLILAALDCERRLASRGPQVLQLIKPRG